MDCEAAKKRRESSSPKSKRAAPCTFFSTTPSKPLRPFLQTCLSALAKPWLVSVVIVCTGPLLVCKLDSAWCGTGMFVATMMNGEAEIPEDKWQCGRRWTDQTTKSPRVYSEKPGDSLIGQSARHLTPLSLPAASDDRLTLMLNSFHRPALMRRSVAHYSKCNRVIRQIRVIWCEDGAPPPDSPSLDGGVDVRYDVANGTSLNVRFAPVQGTWEESVTHSSIAMAQIWRRRL